jgi:hypothetical protein
MEGRSRAVPRYRRFGWPIGSRNIFEESGNLNRADLVYTYKTTRGVGG